MDFKHIDVNFFVLLKLVGLILFYMLCEFIRLRFKYNVDLNFCSLRHIFAAVSEEFDNIVNVFDA